LLNLRRGQPHLHRLDRPQPVAARDGDFLARSFLIGLQTPDRDAQAVGHLREVSDFEGDELRAPEGSGKARRQERPVAFVGECIGTVLQHLADEIGGRAGDLRIGAVAMARRIPRMTALTASALVGGSEKPASLCA
jgi:hypothetical protein